MSPNPVAPSPFIVAPSPEFAIDSLQAAQRLVEQKFFPHALEQLNAVQRFMAAGRLVQAGPLTLSDFIYGADLRMDFAELATAYHVNVPLSGTIQSRHRSIDVTGTPEVAAVFRPRGQTIITRWAAQTRSMCVKIDRAVVDRTLAETLRDTSSPDNAFEFSIDLGSAQARSWISLLKLLMRDLGHPDGLLHQPIAAMPFTETVVNSFLMLTNSAYRQALEHLPEPYRPATIRAAIDIIHAEAHLPLTTATLARRCNVKVRTLQEGFQRHLGTPPMAYLRSVRLAQAHAELRAADPSRDTVAAIAHRWGFTNLSRFANQHLATYHEFPSETLRSHNRYRRSS